jgi:MFS family permease
LIDKFGGRIILISGLTIKAIATASFAFVSTKEQVLIVATFMALGDAANWPAQSVCLTRLVDEQARQKVFAFSFMALNLGIGIGGIISSLVITAGNLSSYQRLYILDALTFVIYLSFAISLPKWVGQRLNKEDKQEGSYKEVFRIKDLMRLFRASILMILFGYASVSAGLPLFITSVLDASPKWLGLIWAANCLAIVLLQAPVLKWVERNTPKRILIYLTLGFNSANSNYEFCGLCNW